MQRITPLLRETYELWRTSNPSRASAAISYYAIFSMAPLFIVLISIAGFLFRSDLVEGRLLYHISAVAGTDITTYVSSLITQSGFHSAGIVSGMISLIILIYGAGGVFRELAFTVNRMWSSDEHQKPKRISGYKQIGMYLKSHIPSLILMVILSCLFIFSILGSVILQSLSDQLRIIYPNAFSLAQAVEPLMSFIFVTIFFGAIYRIVPKIKLPWQDITLGASATALTFLLGESLIGYYLGHYVDSSAFGAAGTLITIMFWVYFSAQVFYFGAAFTYIFSQHKSEQRRS